MEASSRRPSIQHPAISIQETLEAEPLCEQIVRFLLANENAMDTAKGIAAWWVHSDEIAVQAALDRLIACGVVALYPLTSGMLFGLTRNHEVRTWLRKTYRERMQRENQPMAIADRPLPLDRSEPEPLQRGDDPPIPSADGARSPTH